jgi:hypothetical protein
MMAVAWVYFICKGKHVQLYSFLTSVVDRNRNQQDLWAIVTIKKHIRDRKLKHWVCFSIATNYGLFLWEANANEFLRSQIATRIAHRHVKWHEIAKTSLREWSELVNQHRKII